jgi:hypothetical protein
MGVPVAVGLLLTVFAAVTLGPALLTAGSAIGLFEPKSKKKGRTWRRVGTAIVRWPAPILAVSVAVASSTMLDRLRRILPYVNRIGGVLLVVVGAYVTYYGVYEIRLFGGGVGAADPVITAAGRLQATLAGWVHQHGALPWLVVLIAGTGLAAVLTATTVRYRRRSGRRP